jgi:hypothetical protein
MIITDVTQNMKIAVIPKRSYWESRVEIMGIYTRSSHLAPL